VSRTDREGGELLAKICSALSREGVDVQVTEALVGLIEEALRSQARQPVARWCFRLP
jgi:plasmid replication initiation protein